MRLDGSLSTEVGIGEMEIDPGPSGDIYLAGGTSLFVSKDGGCSWQQLPFFVDAPPLGLQSSDEPVQITDIDIARYSLDKARIYVQIDVGLGYLQGNHGASFVTYSDDGGSTWEVLRSTQVGDIAAGRGWLTVAPSDPSTLYITRGDQLTWRLFVSHDQGMTWEERTIPGIAPEIYMPAQLDSADRSPLAVNPTDAKDLWAVATILTTASGQLSQTLIHSTDEGRTWTPVDNPIATAEIKKIWGIDVTQVAGQPAHVAITNTRNVYVSTDAGRSWSVMPDAPVDTNGYPSVSLGEPGFVFIVTRNHVARVDLERGVLRMIKGRTYLNPDVGGLDRLEMRPPQYIPAGLFIQADCRDSDPHFCRGLIRFDGKGA